MIEPTDAEIKIAAVLLKDAFAGKLGFPESPNGLRMMAKGFGRICWFQHYTEISGRSAHPDIGDPLDHEWLIEQAVERFDRMPPLIALRKMHEKYFPNRDGRSAASLEAE